MQLQLETHRIIKREPDAQISLLLKTVATTHFKEGLFNLIKQNREIFYSLEIFILKIYCVLRVRLFCYESLTQFSHSFCMLIISV